MYVRAVLTNDKGSEMWKKNCNTCILMFLNSFVFWTTWILPGYCESKHGSGEKFEQIKIQIKVIFLSFSFPCFVLFPQKSWSNFESNHCHVVSSPWKVKWWGVEIDEENWFNRKIDEKWDLTNTKKFLLCFFQVKWSILTLILFLRRFKHKQSIVYDLTIWVFFL